MKKRKDLEIILSVFTTIFVIILTILGQTNVINKKLSGNIVNWTITLFFLYQGIKFLKAKRFTESILCFLYVIASILAFLL